MKKQEAGIIISDSLNCVAEIIHLPLGEKGEDAFAYDFSRPDLHAQAVFDGCGGAGAWRYQEFKQATGAFIASHAVAERFQPWLEEIYIKNTNDPEDLAYSFHLVTEQMMQQLKGHCAPMGVSGSLVKSFPCTATVALIHQEEPYALTLTALNAGDSRVYFLTPNDGLIQVTRDDSRGQPDPLESLRDSVPLSNMLNADKPYHIRSCRLRLPLPCAVLCATDGMFGFLRSPMDFEYLLLDALVHASCIAEFESRLKASITCITGDDSTMIMSFYGWRSFPNISQSMLGRYHYIQGIIKVIDAAGQNPLAIQAAVIEQWQLYKSATLFYERQE